MAGSANQDDEGLDGAPTPAIEAPRSASAPGAGDPALLAELLDNPAGLSHPARLRLGTKVGRFVAWDPGQPPSVEFEGNSLGPLAVRSVIPLDLEEVEAAIASGRGVLLTFEDGRPDAPIVTGLVHDLGRPEAGHELGHELGAEAQMGETEHEAELPDGTLETRVDGRRVEIEAADEIVLRCGQASIVLRRNGRVVIRGTYVETRSRGVNRIKGGSVEIN